ncbi:hypothetical protein JOC37_001422 [Desulfohalotomaculum tongense]|nr:hypothetical protein [Desulforadius tongensis]
MESKFQLEFDSPMIDAALNNYKIADNGLSPYGLPWG